MVVAMLFEEERKSKLVQHLQQNGRASVQELSTLFDVSESTIRRDLKELEDARLLKRTHGGAVCLESVNFEPNVLEKEDQFKQEKEKIGAAAFELIHEGDSIFLDSGTTTLQLAKELRKAQLRVTVITNSIIVLNELRDARHLEVSMVGGIMRAETLAFVGPMAERCMEMITVDKAFIATNGLDLKHGITTPNLIEAATKRKMLQIAKEVILLCDHSKVGKVTYAKVADLNEIDHCIIDGQLDVTVAEKIKKQHVKLTIV